MNETLPIALRITGGALIGLALLHVPIARHLNWREDCSRLTPVNSAIFHVHALFICLMLVLMGLPALVDPAVFIERSRAGGWLSWSFAGFWMFRLYCQWFVYKAHLWQNKRFETAMHWLFTFVWGGFATVFLLCGIRQAGWWQ
jgi:hypothetical protein